MSLITGIHQSDIIIRTAILEGIADLRRNPYLLDYVFASLNKDDLTSKVYGQKEISQAKSWFLKTDVPVFLNTRQDKSKFPCISVGLNSSIEQENTLADVDGYVQEDVQLSWDALTPVFVPTGYDPFTGQMKVPSNISENLLIYPGMVLMDDLNIPHEILDIIDQNTVQIQPLTNAPFNKCVIKGQPPTQTVTLESCKVQENYSIGVHAQGDSVYCIYLHSILVFILLRYRQDLLEARGFERTSLNTSDLRRNEFFEAENVFSRYISIQGVCQQVWPKYFYNKITGTGMIPLIGDPGSIKKCYP